VTWDRRRRKRRVGRRGGRRGGRRRGKERRRFGKHTRRCVNLYWLYNRRILDERRRGYDRRNGKDRRRPSEPTMLDDFIASMIRIRRAVRRLQRRIWPPAKPPRSGL
jgi:hypothetical protein